MIRVTAELGMGESETIQLEIEMVVNDFLIKVTEYEFEVKLRIC